MSLFLQRAIDWGCASWHLHWAVRGQRNPEKEERSRSLRGRQTKQAICRDTWVMTAVASEGIDNDSDVELGCGRRKKGTSG